MEIRGTTNSGSVQKVSWPNCHPCRITKFTARIPGPDFPAFIIIRGRFDRSIRRIVPRRYFVIETGGE